MTLIQTDGETDSPQSREVEMREQHRGIDFKAAYETLIRAYVRVQLTTSENHEVEKEKANV